MSFNQSFLLGQAAADEAAGALVWTMQAGASSDAGIAIMSKGQTGWISAAPGTELLFKAVRVSLRWTMPVTLRILLQIDRKPSSETAGGITTEYMTYDWTVPIATEPQVQTFDIPLRRKVTVSGVQRRYHPRGVRGRVTLLAPVGLGPGILSIEGLEVETEPLEEQQAAP